ncbi:MAG: PTS sugar transporter subunit IIA [Lentisphaeria bacterium]|nr:PTS sugar transporter subunit IIA [Lentisphaeria bacterium]
MPHRSMNLKEAAAFLHLPESDVRALAMHGELPCEHQGERLNFRRGELKVWSSQRILGLQGKHLHDYHSRGVLKPHDLSDHSAILSELTRPEFMEPIMPAKTRASVLRQIVRVAERTGFLYDPADLVAELAEREELCSTGVEGGVALLHPRHHDPYMVEDSFLCVGRSVQPVPFGASDGRRTDVFFMICCQNDRIHLHVLSRICLLCHSTGLAQALREADTAEEMHAAVVKCEKDALARI